jgi:hypothetical protein
MTIIIYNHHIIIVQATYQIHVMYRLHIKLVCLLAQTCVLSKPKRLWNMYISCKIQIWNIL